MAKMIFYPIGNADSTLIHLNDDRLILYDFCDEELQENDKRVNLGEELRAYLKEQGRNEFDLVVFTHADDDHINRAEHFFWLDHAQKYQSEGRVKINTLVVPACFLLEVGLRNTARVIREEAKFRLKEGKGILVVGEPESLNEWLEDEGIEPELRSHLIIRAGTCLPGFDEVNGQIEIFIHSPFTYKLENENTPRNSNCLVTHLTFFEPSNELRCMLGGDANYEDWSNIIYITCANGNQTRLDWDVFHISHHCSYTALSDVKGEDKTTPKPEIMELYMRASQNCLLISSSEVIPLCDTIQPPHKQAAAFYRDIAEKYGDKENFIVTMAWPSKDRPRPIVVETTPFGFKLRKHINIIGGTSSVIGKPSPRLGGY